MDESLSAAFAISAVGPADFEEWVELALELWPEEEESDRQELRDTLAEALKAKHKAAWLARNTAGAAIAFMNLSLRRDYVPGATQSPVAFVEGIYVRAPYRQQGVGALLIRWAEQWAQQQGCSELASDALIENQGSYQFHTKVGFEEVERVVCFIKPIS
ncbi:MAG: aminoglycoside 6'-N-acetyltransferase [Cyanobacteria bacterium P01_A01_bin.135]